MTSGRPSCSARGPCWPAGRSWWAWNRSRLHRRNAPGRPGAVPRWSFSAKDGVGTALGPNGQPGSRVWFTLYHGAFTEIFYPRADQPAVQAMALIVTDSRGLFSDERWDAGHEMRWLAEGVPVYELVNTCRQGRYRIEKTMLAHPRRDAVLQLTHFVPLIGSAWMTTVSSRLFTRIWGTWVDTTRPGSASARACRCSSPSGQATPWPWPAPSPGPSHPPVSSAHSDGLRDLQRHGRLTRTYDRAEDGNVALVGEVDLRAAGGRFVLAMGFGGSPAEAAYHARASLLDDFDALREEYVRQLARLARDTVLPSGLTSRSGATCTESARPSCDRKRTRACQGRLSPVSRSRGVKPAGTRSRARSDTTSYGLATWWKLPVRCWRPERTRTALRVLRYLQTTQEGDGHWPQNQWADGTQAWDSIQMGETALPILLVDQLKRAGRAHPRRARAVLAHGPRGGQLHPPRRPIVARGPMGGRPRLHSVHARGLDLRPASRRRTGRRERRARGRGLLCGNRPTPGKTTSISGLTSRTPSWPAGSVFEGYYLRIAPLDDSRRTVQVRRSPGALVSPEAPSETNSPRRSSVPMPWPMCGSVCGPRTTRASSTP